jgi:hypothetical protein
VALSFLPGISGVVAAQRRACDIPGVAALEQPAAPGSPPIPGFYALIAGNVPVRAHGPQPTGYRRMFTARAATNSTVVAEIADSASIIIFTRRVSGIASVGLKATALVNEMYT